MKKTFTSIALIACAIMTTMDAHASDGSITFNGRLTDTTCTIDVNGGGKLGVVQLPTIPAATLPTSGTTAAPTKFYITLTQCSGSANQVLAYFENNNAYVNSATGNLKNLITDATGATNVELQLLDSTGKVIMVGDDNQHDGPATPISGGNATIQHAVQYYATDEAGAGLVQGQVTYQLTYP